MNMKRTLQTILFALVAMMVPIGAWAQVTDAVAKVGDTEYADFAEALANWTDGTTLTLLADIPNETRTTTIEIADKTVTLDLNGCTLDMSSVETAVEVKDGTLNICDSGENGTLKGGKYTVYTYYDAVLNVSDGCLTASRIAAYLNTGEFNISGGTLTSEYGIWNSYATVNISGSPTISGTRAALFNYNKMTISDTPVLCGGDRGDLYMEVPITLNTQPADGTWSVYMTRKNITTNNGVFALPGEGMTLDASKFTSMMDGYEVKLNTKGELLLCNHQTAYAAVSNEDGSTHRMLCYCGETIVEASVTCSGGMATCQDKAVCKHCGQSYGAVDPNVHTFGDDGKCGCGAERGEATTVDLSALTGTYVISDSEEYIFTGSGSYGIKVEKGNPRIVLNNANITVGEGSAIDVASGSNTTIFVLGDNTIGTTKTESWNEPCGGIFVTEGGTVNITSNGTNNILRAHGTLAAAIGGKYVYAEESYNAGNISISNVTVYAYTNNYYAAAIGAAGVGTCGTINITNAVVYAYGAGDRWTSAPGIGSAWSLVGCPETIPVVIISDSELHTFRCHSVSDYIGYLGDVNGNVDGSTFATGSINCGDGGSVKNSTIYCYTGLDAITTDKVVKYGALGGLLKEDGTCEGEHSFTGNICDNCGYCSCTHEGSEHTCTDNGDGTHSFTCSICGEKVTEVHSYTLTAESNMLTEVCACGHPNGTITIEAADKTYDGKAVEVVITKVGSLENADIPIAYTKDGEAFTGDPIEAGSYTATITMEEKSASVEFTIVQANVEAAEIALEYDETVYDGTEKTPAVTAVVVDGVAIDSASYDVTYADNTAIGTATVTITFKGNYTGTVSTTFEILEDTTDVDMTTVGGGQATVIYDLTGRRVTKMEKGGIYIVDGKKVFLRK